MPASNRSSSAIQRILLLEPFWIAVLAGPLLLPGRFAPPAVQPLFVAALFLFWPLRWLNYRLSPPNDGSPAYASQGSTGRHLFFPPQSPLSLALLLFLILAGVWIWAAADRTTAWAAAGYLLYGIAVCAALINWRPARQHPEYVAAILMAFGALLSLVAPFLVRWKPDFRLFYLPLYQQFQSLSLDIGETVHANILAGALVIVFPLFLAIAVGTQKPSAAWKMHSLGSWLNSSASRVIAALIATGIGLLVVLTQSRGGYLAASAATIVILMLRWPRLAYGLPLLLLAAGLAAARVSFEDILNALSNDGTLGGWNVRIDIWTHSLHALHDFVFTGIGIGTFTTVMPLLYPLKFDIEGYPHAHNLFLQVGVDTGLPGLITWVSLQINLVVMLTSTWRKLAHSDSRYRVLLAGCIGGFVAIHVHGLLDAATWGVKLAFVPWMLYALVALLFLHSHTNSEG